MRTWVARSVVVALVIALVEITLLLPVFPAAASSATGLFFAYVAIARVYLLLTLPAGLLAWGLERWFAPVRAPEPAWVISTLLALVVGSCLFHLLTPRILAKEVDFPQTREALLLLLGIITLGIALGIERSLLTRVMYRFVLSMPRLGQRDVVAACGLGLLAMGALVAAHAVLAPVHQVTLCAIAGSCAAVLSLTAAGIAWRSPSTRLQTVTTALAAVLLMTVGVDKNPTGRFVLYGPASTAGPIAAAIRRFMDRDSDGASPVWLGGTDCAEGNPLRGPHRREQAGDGVDQDCCGGDAPSPSSEATSIAHFPLENCQIPSTPRSVLLITIDALRADTPSLAVMPNLVALARSSMVFDRAYAASTMTGPSLGGLFSGHPLLDLHPDNASSDEPLIVTTSLAERFKATGYRTAAFNRVALKTTSFSGFDEYNPYPADVQPRGKGQLLAAGMVNGALAYMERSDPRPFFVWIHFLDTHAPYVFDGSSDLLPSQIPLSPYQRGAQYVDAHLGRLVRELARLNLFSQMVSAVTADHGEQMGTRARLGHGPYLFEDVINVPLVLSAPQCSPGVVTEPVSLTHLGNALSDLAGISPGAIPPSSVTHLPVVVEEAPVSLLGFKRAVISDQYKLIVDVMNGGRMLFDLESDPAEATDLYAARPDLAERMETAYQNWLDHPQNR